MISFLGGVIHSGSTVQIVQKVACKKHTIKQNIDFVCLHFACMSVLYRLVVIVLGFDFKNSVLLL